jgi:serine/threonine protein kinase
MKANREKWGKNKKSKDDNADDYAFLFVKPTLTDDHQKMMEQRIRECSNNSDLLFAANQAPKPDKSKSKPKKVEPGPNMKALLNADQNKLTVAEKQEHLKKKYRAKHDIGDITNLNTTKRNPKNKGEKSTIPPFSLKKCCAPSFNIDLKQFKPKETEKNEFQKKILKKVIADSVILKDNSKKTEDKIVRVMEEVRLKRGEILAKQGVVDEKDDRYYVVEQGAVEFQVDGVTVDKADAGTAFGEDRLLYRHANHATIKASEDTKLLRLDQQIFRGIMQQEQMKIPKPKAEPKEKPRKKTKTKLKTIAGDWDLSGSSIFQEQRSVRDGIKKQASSKDDLEFIRILGEGQFGEVWLVAAKVDEKEKFALKMQDCTDDEIRDNPINAIKQEITALQAVHHPFIVNLVHVYESEESIDMLLGLIEGNELWDEVHREEEPEVWVSGFSEARARFYTCVLVDTLAFLHKNKFCFRDLKPENIMIDEDGYPVLVDFGFAKSVPEGDKTFTFCGTPNYVAPEIIKMAGHDHNVDYWALGVVIYEMVSGENPFCYEGIEQFELYQAITDEQPYELEGDVTPAVVDLINKLLEKDPSKRLGSGHPHDILEHKWFNGVPDLAEYRAKRVEPPPMFQGNEDLLIEEINEDKWVSEDEWESKDELAEETRNEEIFPLIDPYKCYFSSQDVDLIASRDDEDGVDKNTKQSIKIKTFKEPIKLTPWIQTNKGNKKGYYAKERSKEDKLSSKERRALLAGVVDKLTDNEHSP